MAFPHTRPLTLCFRHGRCVGTPLTDGRPPPAYFGHGRAPGALRARDVQPCAGGLDSGQRGAAPTVRAGAAGGRSGALRARDSGSVNERRAAVVVRGTGARSRARSEARDRGTREVVGTLVLTVEGRDCDRCSATVHPVAAVGNRRELADVTVRGMRNGGRFAGQHNREKLESNSLLRIALHLQTVEAQF